MNDFLKEIVAHKQALIKEKKPVFDSIKRNVTKVDYTRYSVFRRQISKPGQINLIAEIKKASPSQGLIREDFDALKIAQIYVHHGAAAISVLTEERYFLGKPMYAKKVADQFNVPILIKDFIIDEGQIFEARSLGATAVLLIMAILEDKQAKDFIRLAASVDVDCLVEVHDEEELNRALKCGAEIIGINNRDLHTFKVDFYTCERLIPKIPSGKTIVAESGISENREVKKLQQLGAHAVLIGEAFMREKDIGAKIEEVMYGGKG